MVNADVRRRPSSCPVGHGDSDRMDRYRFLAEGIKGPRRPNAIGQLATAAKLHFGETKKSRYRLAWFSNCDSVPMANAVMSMGPE
jgi:hypothetical protein